jgi:hypothetical protein
VQPNQPVEERGARLAAYARRLMQAAPFQRSIAAGPAKSIIYKGVQCEDALKAAFGECARLSQDGQVLVTTDMRAFANPTRMNSIRLLADLLAERVACPCPARPATGASSRNAAYRAPFAAIQPILSRLKSWAASRANAARRGRGPMVPHRRRQRTVPGAILRTEPPKGRSEQTAWRFLLRERRKKGAPWGAFIVEVLREAAISCRGSCGASASGSGA